MKKKGKGLLAVSFILFAALLVGFWGVRGNNAAEESENLLESIEPTALIDRMNDLKEELNNSEVEGELTEEIQRTAVPDGADASEKEWELTEWGETNEFFGRSDNARVYFYQRDHDTVPDELVDYLTKALEEEQLIEQMEQISADYRIFSEDEKEAFDRPKEEWGLGVALYYSELKDDVWYCVTLTEEGNDLVVEHVGEDGCIVNYFFWNIKQWGAYPDAPLRSGGQRKSTPYFITWDNMNYMAIPYWDAQANEMIGVVVYRIYDMYSADVVAIGKNSDGTIEVTYQKCEILFPREQLTMEANLWPIVVTH